MSLPKFKNYNQNQIDLLPISLEDLITENDLVRVLNSVVDKLDLRKIYKTYPGGGASSYDPRMLLKVILYAYCLKIYTGRKIARAIKRDVHFIWLSGQNSPDFRTINNFRSGKLKKSIEGVFQQVIMMLMEEGYIKMENYFCDGSSIEANANKNKVIWKKNSIRYKKQAEDQCLELFQKIDKLNEEEEQQYGEKDLEETGSFSKKADNQTLEQYIENANNAISSGLDKSKKKEAVKCIKELKKQKGKIEKYDQQIRIAGERSGYSKTDNDSGVIYTKDDILRPAYNVVVGSEDQFIVNYTVHQNPNDSACFVPHLDELEKQGHKNPENICADSIFGTEENYNELEKKKINSYLKYPSFRKENSEDSQKNPFARENFEYDNETDTYKCPYGGKLNFKEEREKKTKSGFNTISKIYECQNCKDCPFVSNCNRGEGNKTIEVNKRLDGYKAQARNNLNSEKGIKIQKKRGYDIETCFGDIKHNQNFRRFHLRGLKKVKTEFGLISICHNIRKMHIILRKMA
ncbi:MAG: IS1182 family transposase [Bacteroidota bacterium]|nr:IS1182 family transposase [Bacteroidota bacterium]